jgi:signal transduction histidine kinase
MLPKNIAIEMALGSGDVTVLADVSKIDQVLLNLVTNARDAMPRGGRIVIRSRTVNLDEDFRRLYGYGTPGRYVLITVTDTGEGIDDEAIHRIFEPFYTRKKAGKGTGLGLAIVYGIVKQHNGYINVSSKPSKGTTFNIYLPAAKVQ